MGSNVLRKNVIVSKGGGKHSLFLHWLSLGLMQYRHCDVIHGVCNTLGQCSVLLWMADLLYMVAEGF